MLDSCIRQGVVNGLIMCESGPNGPFLFKGRFAERRSCGYNNLLKRFMLGRR